MKPLSGMNDRLQPGMSMAAASRAAWRDAMPMEWMCGKERVAVSARCGCGEITEN
jgi:hypothetical protein